MRVASPELQLSEGNGFYFRQVSINEGSDSKSEIFLIKTLFSDYQPICILTEKSHNFDYVSFKVDIQQQVILLFIREQYNKNKLFVQIVEISNPESILVNCEIID